MSAPLPRGRVACALLALGCAPAEPTRDDPPPPERPTPAAWPPPSGRAAEIDEGWKELHDPRALAEWESLRAEAAAGRDDARLHLQLGRAGLALGRNAEAERHLDRALALDPSKAAAHYRRGILRHGLERYEEALADYRAALALREDHAPTHATLARTLVVLGREEEAREHYARAHALDPGNADAAFQLGLLLRRDGPERALELFEHAARVDPHHLGAAMNLARAYRRAGREAEAAVEQERHAKLARLADLGVLDTPREPVRFVVEARYFARAGRWDAALEVCARGQALHPHDASLRWIEAAILVEAERPAEAVEAFERAVALAPDERGYTLGLARLVAVGHAPTDPAAVREHLSRAERAWPDEAVLREALRRLGAAE